MMVNKKKILLFFYLLFFCVLVSVYAEDPKTDLYAPVYQKPLKSSSLKDPVSGVIAFPFELVRWPIDKTLVFIDKNRLEQKAKWLYEQSIEYGVTPRLDSLSFEGLPCYGGNFDLVRMLRQRENYPDLIARSWVNHGPTVYFEAGGELGAQRIGDTGFHVSEIVQYSNRRDENFYGFGSRSSRGDSGTFIEERTTAETILGYEFSPTLDLSSQFGFDHVNIKNRAHEGKHNIAEIFAGQDIPGLYGDSVLSYALGFKRDTRDSKTDATKGSYQKILLKFSEGIESSKARYFTYQFDMAKYFRLASPRRIFITRVFGEHNQTVHGGDVPFYNMAKLGSLGTFPRKSQTARGYIYNRYTDQSALLFNLEYRYTIWQYREFKLNAAVFVDEGQVFGDFKKMKFSNFRESYGGGLYLTYSQNMLAQFSVAHGREGTQFYIENKIPF